MKKRWVAEERTAMIAGPPMMNLLHSSYSGRRVEQPGSIDRRPN